MRVLEWRLQATGERWVWNEHPRTAGFQSPSTGRRPRRQVSERDGRSIYRPALAAIRKPSSEPRFERGGQIGLFIAVLHDHGGLQSKLLLGAPSVADGARAGNDDCAF